MRGREEDEEDAEDEEDEDEEDEEDDNMDEEDEQEKTVDMSRWTDFDHGSRHRAGPGPRRSARPAGSPRIKDVKASPGHR